MRNRLKAPRVGRGRTAVGGLKTAAALAAVGLVCLCGFRPAKAVSVRDIQLVGLPFLYEALFAVANCSNLELDQRAFARAARLYHLTPDDLRASGPFGPDIADLDASDRIRLDDDHAAFCGMSRLSFAVPHGVLFDLGPVVPHPLPFGHED